MLDLVLRRWHLKLLALAIAFAVWVAVTGDTRIATAYRVPLDVTLRADQMLTGSAPTTVTVLVRGPETVLRRLDAFALEMQVDLRDAEPGERSVVLSAASLAGLPPGADVTRIDPDRFTLTLATKARRTIPISPNVVGSPATGFAFYWAESRPDAVEVEGPDTKVETLHRLRTDPIPLDGRTEPFLARVGAVSDDPEIRILETRPLEVRVIVDVAPIERRFGSVPVTLAGRAGGAVAVPGEVEVVLAGPPSILEGLGAGRVRAVADVSRPADETGAYPVRVDFAGVPLDHLSRLSVRSVRPGRVAVRPGETG